jgi:hypothetical protein
MKTGLMVFSAAGRLRPQGAGSCRGGDKAAAPAAASGREEVLKSLAKEGDRAKAGAGEKDDFIDVDDRKGLKKSWPMLLFIGLIGVAIGALYIAAENL